MANKIYENFVLENKFEDLLTTKVDLSNYMTVDTSLTEAPGMKKKIHKYTATGDVQDLAMGEGNTDTIESTFTEVEYEVGTTQARGIYHDEEAMADPITVDNILRAMADKMANDFTRKAIKEYGKASRVITCDFETKTANYFFDCVVDALAMFGEDETGLTLLISPAQQAYVRKQLGDNLKYVEGFVRTGYIGSVSGVPVVVSKAVPATQAYIVNNEAVRLFIKKGTEAEQDRDADHRKNILYLRKVALVALVDDTKIVALSKAQATECAITTYTKGATTVAGTCGTDVKTVDVAVNDKHYTTTATGGAWTLTADANLATGDVIVATAYAEGYAPAVDTKTVA